MCYHDPVVAKEFLKSGTMTVNQIRKAAPNASALHELREASSYCRGVCCDLPLA